MLWDEKCKNCGNTMEEEEEISQRTDKYGTYIYYCPHCGALARCSSRDKEPYRWTIPELTNQHPDPAPDNAPK